MTQISSAGDRARRIDLTNEADVLYWCGIFALTMDQLREAVQHAGPQVDDVGRYLREKTARPG